MDSERRIKQLEKKLGTGKVLISINLAPLRPLCPKCQVLHQVVAMQPCQPNPCPDCRHFCGI